MAPNANFYGLFVDAASRAGNKPFLVEDGETRLAYAGLDAETGRWAQALTGLGATPGDRILVQVEKSVENVLLYLASLRGGLVYVPLNTAYTPAELAYFIADAEPVVIVCDPAREEAITPLVDSARLVDSPRLVTLASDGTGSMAEMAAQASTVPFETVARSDRDLAAICYTSGTTGRSKGAMLSHANLSSNALTLYDYWHWRPEDVLIHALPVYHVHGLFVALHLALLGGSTIRFHKGFDAEAVLADMPGASVLMGVPTFYVRLAAHEELSREAAATMRLFISGSAPLLESTFGEFEAKTGHRILERYGMTEAGMICSNPYDGARKGGRVPGTVGFALPGVEVRLGDEEDDVSGSENPGVLEIKGPNLFRGYWNKPEQTQQDMRGDGYFITGDIATIDEQGRVAIVGRAKDLIIAGGLNIYPKEIELAIDAVEGVVESAVIGVPHPDLGEATVAVVVRSVSTLDEATVLAGVTDLARFKQPRRVIFADALPRNAMGKVQKAKLREEFRELFG